MSDLKYVLGSIVDNYLPFSMANTAELVTGVALATWEPYMRTAFHCHRRTRINYLIGCSTSHIDWLLANEQGMTGQVDFMTKVKRHNGGCKLEYKCNTTSDTVHYHRP